MVDRKAGSWKKVLHTKNAGEETITRELMVTPSNFYSKKYVSLYIVLHYFSNIFLHYYYNKLECHMGFLCITVHIY